jgi:hypothetical protein
MTILLILYIANYTNFKRDYSLILMKKYFIYTKHCINNADNVVYIISNVLES